MQAVLIGLPNSGKSTLFQCLTGKRVKTGNRAGVTVDARSAPIPGTDWTLTDLPGIRTEEGISEDERVTVSRLADSPPDLVLAVCDATAVGAQAERLQRLRRALFPQIPTVLVLTFCDELERFPQAEHLRGVSTLPIVPVSARTGNGIARLRALFARGATLPQRGTAIVRWADLVQAVGPIAVHRRRSVAAWDRLLLHPLWGVLLFFALTAGTMWLVFGPFVTCLSDGFSAVFLAPLGAVLERLPQTWWKSLLSEGILGGVGSVFGFLPRLLLLFLVQTFLEQSGYLARTATLFDPLLSRFGLRGDAIAPLLLGYGCTVSAVLCTRGMKDAQARKRCACYLPMVACSARIPLCLTVSDAFFPGNGWWICAFLWVASGVVFLGFCALDARLCAGGATLCHADALPLLRFPAVGDLLGSACEQLLHFLGRAGGPICLTSVGIWLLSHFMPGHGGIVPLEESLLAFLGGAIAPLLAPLGLADWRVVASLLAGIGAKEATLSTLGVLLGVKNGNVGAALVQSGILRADSALALLVFYLFYFPCSATWSLQTRPRKWFFPLLFAYLFAWLTVIVYP